jgi:hypothetical protein
MSRPHDASDLLLAPVALEVDARIQELAGTDSDALRFRVALEGNVDLSNPAMIVDGVIEACTNGIDMHHWEATIDARGLRISHADHTIVLGLPANVTELLS